MSYQSLRSKYLSPEKIESDKDFPWLHYFIRPISLYASEFFQKLGFSANQVTVLSIVLSIVGGFLIASANYETRIVGGIILNLWIILDCVDGNLARFNKKASPFGEFMDALGGYILNAVVFLFTGLGAVNEVLLFDIEPIILLFIAACSSSIWLLTRLAYQKYQVAFNKNEDQTPSHYSTNASRTIYFLSANIMFASGFFLPIVLVAILLNVLHLFVVVFFFLNLLVLVKYLKNMFS